MNNHDHFNILRKIQHRPQSSQRQLANELGFSLGKLNYLLKALNNKRLIKINRFKKNKNKIGYIYVLTPTGISKRSKMALDFMKKKLEEYEELKKDITN